MPPSNTRQLAKQAVTVATLVLNGQIDLEVARTYAAIVRTAAQAMSAETTRARFIQEAPNLGWEDES